MNSAEEKKIANDFISINSAVARKQFVRDLPKPINVDNIQKFLPNDSKKYEFSLYFYNKENVANKYVRNFIRKKNKLVMNLKKFKNNYNEVRNILNPLREKKEDLLRKEVLKLAANKFEKYRTFYMDIMQAEIINELIKESNYNVESLKDILAKNSFLIENNKIIYKNLEDLFKFDAGLNNLHPIISKFFKNLENDKSVNDIIHATENKILNGDISNIYEDIEENEKKISTKVSVALMDIFNSIQIMEGKRNFVKYIQENNDDGIYKNDVDYLLSKSQEYRNVVLPKKWLEIKKKLKFTNKLAHYSAWYHGLQQGRYKTIVANVKEYIVKEIIKKIFIQITETFKNIDINNLKLSSLINTDNISTEILKKAYLNFFEIPQIKKTGRKGILLVFDDFFIYYLYLKYDLQKEVEIINEIINNLHNIKSIDDKIKFLEIFKNKNLKSIQDENFKNHMYDILDKFLFLFNLLAGNQADKNEEDLSNDIVQANIFFNQINDEFETTGKIENLKSKIESLPEIIKMDVINTINFDSRFEEYFNEVEDILYNMDYGRALGLITLKVKYIEKNLGMIASEEYLDDLANRLSLKIGKNSILTKKVINMKSHLRSVHSQSTKKLKFMQEKLGKCRNSAEKILELQRLSKDPRYRGIFGVVKNMERILIRDHFNEIYDKVKKLPVDNQIALFASIKSDIEDLFIYEPALSQKINNYVSIINRNVANYREKLPKVNDEIIDSIQKFEDGELSLINVAELLGVKQPQKDEYKKEAVEYKLSDISHNVNNRDVSTDDLELIIEDVYEDISLFKMENTDESVELAGNANYLIEGINQNIDKLKKIDELIADGKPDAFINKIMKENESDEEKLNSLENIFNESDYDYDRKEKGFIIAVKSINDDNTKTKLSEIVDVVRRIKKEVEPLYTIEAKTTMIEDWIQNEYKDKNHIVEFLNKEIERFKTIQSHEGGLIHKLLDGLDKSKDKQRYLKEKLNDPEFKQIKHVINNLLHNLKEELGITEEDINEEFIDSQLSNKTDDEQLSWIKTRQNWSKYEKCKDYLDNKAEEKINKILHKKIEIIKDIVELAEKVMELPNNRQSFIKYQIDNDKDGDKLLQSKRKLLFYLFATDTNNPAERLKSLSGRYTIKMQDKKNFLYLLKIAKSDDNNIFLKDKLNITDEMIAYNSLAILYQDKSDDIKIKYLERFKSSDDENVIKYKEKFEITNNIINKYIEDLRKKSTDKSDSYTDELIYDNDLNDNKTTENKNESHFVKEEITETSDLSKNEPTFEIIPEKIKNNIERLDNFNLNNDYDEIKKSTDGPKVLNFSDDSEKGFTAEEIKNLNKSKPAMIHKSLQEIIAEQTIIEDIKKRKKIIQKLEEKAKEKNKENIKKIKEKAHSIYENKNKKKEDKISELLAYLATCYPEAVPRIISEEILPVFREDTLNLDVHNPLESINNSVFNLAMNGKDPEENIKFLEKTLSPENILNIRNITNKIKEIWDKESKIYDEELKTKKTEDLGKAKGIGSIIVYLNTINISNVLTELKNNFLTRINNEFLKSKLNMLDDYLTKISAESKAKDSEFYDLVNKLNLEDKYKIVLKNIIVKMVKYNQAKDNLKKIKNEKANITNEKPAHNEAVIEETFNDKEIVYENNNPEIKQEQFNEIEVETKNKNTKNEGHVNIGEYKNSIPADSSNDIKFNEQHTEEKPEQPELSPIEQALITSNRFVKPHLFMLDIIRANKMDETEYSVEKRKSIIKRLYDEGKIFTYDGSTFIGRGFINFLVNSNLIPQNDRSIFYAKLNEFIKKFKTKKEIFEFLGVKDETEFRKLNYNLDKYSLNKTGGVLNSLVSDKESVKEKHEKPKENKIQQRVSENIKKKEMPRLKPPDKKKNDAKVDSIMKNSRAFINKNQREVLSIAEKEINKKLERLIKSSETLEDLMAISKNYFGNSDLNRKNLLNLCHEIKQIATIINDDKDLFQKLSFDRNKIKKLYDSRYNKLK
jgi:hypothetical protein